MIVNQFRGEYFDYDPLTGVYEYLEHNADGTTSIHYYQNLEPHLELAKRLRNEGLPDEAWQKNEASTYAIIPPAIILELRDKGIDIFNPNHMKRLVDEISARPAAQKAIALKDRHAFKTEMDEEAKRSMFPGNYRAQAAG